MSRDRRRSVVLALAITLFTTARCRDAGPHLSSQSDATLRVGIGGLPSQTAERGVQQFVSNISQEGLIRIDRNGRPEPWLAERAETTADGLELQLRLRPNVTFHDGSPLNAEAVAAVLKAGLPRVLRNTSDDLESIAASGPQHVTIRFKRPSTFVAESLIDIPIQKPGAALIGTGPFLKSSGETGPVTMSGFARYYLGAPAISKIEVTAYANGRAAWADLLRSKVDMLYEVGPDAIDLTPGSQVALYAFDRPYQYMVLLNPRKKVLASPEIRRALNEALDRTALVRDGLRNHGTPSTGPVSSQHWAYSEQRGTFTYAPAQAAAILQKAKLRITCLTPAEAPYDRLALIVKQQLAAVGVDLDVQEATPDQINKVFAARDFEAVLVDFISGWSLYRPYRWWHSNGANNLVYSEPSVDAALDRIHHAVNDQDYKSGVEAFQKAVAASPPALFLAWGQRSRAVARAFEVPAQPGRDVLASLRLWRPPADNRKATNH